MYWAFVNNQSAVWNKAAKDATFLSQKKSTSGAK
jgi:hypothetical protein